MNRPCWPCSGAASVRRDWAAELLGRSYVAFLDFLKARGVDYAPGNADDRDADDSTLRWLADRTTDGPKPA